MRLTEAQGKPAQRGSDCSTGEDDKARPENDPSQAEGKEPKHKWWVIGALVPLAVALFAILPPLLDGGSDTSPTLNAAPTNNYTNRDGLQIHGDAEFTTVNNITQQIQAANQEVSPALLKKLETIAAKLKAGEFKQAVPLLEEVRQVAPVPGILNNLGVAYKAIGQVAKGQRFLAKATSEARRPPPEAVSNFRVGSGITVKCKLAGILVELVSFKDTGGMYTLVLRYWNVGKSSVWGYMLWKDYILDERSGKTWKPVLVGDSHVKFQPAESRDTWMKFKIEEGLPEEFTLVLTAANPIERLTLERIAKGKRPD